MGIFEKEKVTFEPNCRVRDDGLVECNPIIREELPDGAVLERKARAVLKPQGGNLYYGLTLEGDARALEELERFFMKRKTKIVK